MTVTLALTLALTTGRRHGIQRWPRRQLVKLSKALDQHISERNGTAEDAPGAHSSDVVWPCPAGVCAPEMAGRADRDNDICPLTVYLQHSLVGLTHSLSIEQLFTDGWSFPRASVVPRLDRRARLDRTHARQSVVHARQDRAQP